MTGLAIACAAALFWATPYFAPDFCYGPLDAVLLLGLAFLAARPTLTATTDATACFAAGFEACVTFLEMMSGELVVAAVWLGAMTLAVARDRPADAGAPAPRVTTVAVVAFVAGVVISVAVKQLLVVVFLGASGVGSFLAHLGHYTTLPEATRVPSVLVPFVQIAKNLPTLTYGSKPMAIALVVGVASVWSAAVVRTHTTIHASLMVRMLVSTIAVAPTAFLWPQATER